MDIKLPNKKCRNKLQKHLKSKGIMSKVYFKPVHLKRIYRHRYKYKTGNLPRTEDLSNKVLTIPLYPDIKYDKLKYMTNHIKAVFNKKQW